MSMYPWMQCLERRIGDKCAGNGRCRGDDGEMMDTVQEEGVAQPNEAYSLILVLALPPPSLVSSFLFSLLPHLHSPHARIREAHENSATSTCPKKMGTKREEARRNLEGCDWATLTGHFPVRKFTGR